MFWDMFKKMDFAIFHLVIVTLRNCLLHSLWRVQPWRRRENPLVPLVCFKWWPKLTRGVSSWVTWKRMWRVYQGPKTPLLGGSCQSSTRSLMRIHSLSWLVKRSHLSWWKSTFWVVAQHTNTPCVLPWPQRLSQNSAIIRIAFVIRIVTMVAW